MGGTMNLEDIKQKVIDVSTGMSLRTRLEIAVAILCGTVWFVTLPATAPVNEWHPATPAPQIKYVPKEVVKIQYVTVYKEAAKQKLDLPLEIKNDPAQHVVDSTVVQSDLHPQTVTSVIDEKTGEIKTVVRLEPLPWLAAEQHGSIGVGYGLTSGLMQGFALNAHEDLVQIKALHFGVDGSMFTGGAYFAGVGVAYHW